jgi:hypothetical protein
MSGVFVGNLNSSPLNHVQSRVGPIGKRWSIFLPHQDGFHKSNIQRADEIVRNPRNSYQHVATMAPISLSDIISALPSEESWGPPTSTETTLNGVPYAPYSKGDKLGRMADWTTEGKDGRDGRGGRQQYNRNYRGLIFCLNLYCHIFALEI